MAGQWRNFTKKSGYEICFSWQNCTWPFHLSQTKRSTQDHEVRYNQFSVKWSFFSSYSNFRMAGSPCKIFGFYFTSSQMWESSLSLLRAKFVKIFISWYIWDPVFKNQNYDSVCSAVNRGKISSNFLGKIRMRKNSSREFEPMNIRSVVQGSHHWLAWKMAVV